MHIKYHPHNPHCTCTPPSIVHSHFVVLLALHPDIPIPHDHESICTVVLVFNVTDHYHSMSEPEHLPLELFQLVIYYCRFNRTSLLNLSLVCRAFLEETRPLVFPFLRIHGRNIQKLIPLVLSPHCSIPDATFTSGITFFLNTPGDLHWLANSFVPQVEGKVRLIALTLAVQYAHPGPLQDVADILQPLRFTSLVHFQYYNFFTDRLDDVVSVLCSMPVLDSVKLQGIARDPSVDPGRRLSTTTLHTLHVSIPEPRQIAEWLNSHEVSPRLRRLVFGNIMENDVDAVNALINVNGPYLKEFIANFPGHGACTTN